MGLVQKHNNTSFIPFIKHNKVIFRIDNKTVWRQWEIHKSIFSIKNSTDYCTILYTVSLAETFIDEN